MARSAPPGSPPRAGGVLSTLFRRRCGTRCRTDAAGVFPPFRPARAAAVSVKEPPRSSLPALLVVLTITTGLIDAVSVMGLGRVFTANMTGNIVFLGFALARVPEFSARRSLAALAAFLIGAVIGGRLGTRLGDSRQRWLLSVAVIESSLLFAAALAASGYDSGALAPVARLYALIALTALAMGIRNATARRLAVPDLTTTVLTLTLTGLAADSWLAGGGNPRWRRRVASVAAMLGGAVVGGLLVLRGGGGLALPLVLTGAITLIATLVYVACAERPANTSRL